MGSTTEPFLIVNLEEEACVTPSTFDLPFPYSIISYERTKASEIASRIAKASIVITSGVGLPEDLLQESICPNLKLISVSASGTDAIHLPTCRRRGIVVCNASPANVPAVSEHAIGLYFAVRRKFAFTDAAIRRDEWVKNGGCGEMMADERGVFPLTCADETMGLIGYGTIGKRIADLGKALGMKVIIGERKGATDIREGRHSFEHVLKEATVLVLILPRTPETTNMISTPEFATMKKSAVIVNVARGGIVNEEALITALKDRQIAGAATDVFLKEPAGPGNSVLVQDDTKDLNLVLTPHSAWAADITIRNMSLLMKQNIEGWTVGKPVNVVP